MQLPPSSKGILAVATLALLAACTYDFDQFGSPEGTSTTVASGGAGQATTSVATTVGAGGATAGRGGGGAAGSRVSMGASGSSIGGSGGSAAAGSGGTSGGAGSVDDSGTTQDVAVIGDDAAEDASDDATTSDAATSDANDAELEGTPDASSDDAVVEGSAIDASEASVDATSDGGCSRDACSSCMSSPECSCASHNGHAYRFCTTARSWTDSEAQCATAGMRLSRVDDALENAWIRSTADAHAMAESWIGIEDPMKTLHWEWPDGTQFWTGAATGSSVGGLYSDWSASNPSGAPVRNCASMLGTSGQWSDRSCTSLLPYVCELY